MQPDKIRTSADTLVELVKKKKVVGLEEAAKKIDMDVKSTKYLAEILSSQKIIDVQYMISGEIVLKPGSNIDKAIIKEDIKKQIEAIENFPDAIEEHDKGKEEKVERDVERILDTMRRVHMGEKKEEVVEAEKVPEKIKEPEERHYGGVEKEIDEDIKKLEETGGVLEKTLVEEEKVILDEEEKIKKDEEDVRRMEDEIDAKRREIAAMGEDLERRLTLLENIEQKLSTVKKKLDDMIGRFKKEIQESIKGTKKNED